MQPVRSADYPAHPALASSLALPTETPLRETTFDEVLAAWRDYLRFDGPLLLLSDGNRARKLLIEAFGIEPGEPVGIPVNTRRYLSEAVKRAKGKPHFVELDADLEFQPGTPGLDQVRLIWAQPVGGMAPPRLIPGKTLFVDHGLTLPAPLDPGGPGLAGAATLWGLHLSEGGDGALAAITDPELAERLAALVTPEELPDLRRALAQCQRLSGPDGLTARQLAREQKVRVGMEAGAGMPMGSRADGALAFGVPVRIPDEADLPTFLSYVRNELVDLDWVPELQPIFYVAYQVTQDSALTRQSAEHLARWVFSPVGPDFVEDEVTHAVLGVLKGAEYTGVRWYTNPGRARWYHEMLIDWYGPEHDAFHAAFAITVPALE
jgi:hypothetical protein